MAIGRGGRREGRNQERRVRRERYGYDSCKNNKMLIDVYELRYTNYFVVPFHKTFNYFKRNILDILKY